uniref:Uncharacterized protein n=1 Tax=viral metagenome TaxID=1070528 RepID=A0A6M3IG39_9ZZZZ
MAADDFTITPTWVDVVDPIFNNVVTLSENYKKDFQNISDIPIERFVLRFIGLSDADAETVYEHYKSRYAGYDDFAWKTAAIPTYINGFCDLGGADLAGRWIDGSLKITHGAYHVDMELTFEKTI